MPHTHRRARVTDSRHSRRLAVIGGAPGAVAIAGVLAFAAWIAFGRDGPSRVMIANLAALPLPIAAAVAAWRARVRELEMRARRAWAYCALAFASYAGGNALWLYYEAVLEIRPSPSWADAVYLGYYLFLLAALVSFPTVRRKRHERATFWIDVAIVMVSASAIVWHFVIEPSTAVHRLTPADVAVTVAYPVADLVLLFGSTIALLRRRLGQRLPIALLGASGVLLFASDMLVNIIALHAPDGHYPSGGWVDPGFQFAALLWFLAPLLVRAEPGESAPNTEAPFAPRAAWLLPTSAMLTGYGLLTVVAVRYWSTELGGIIIATTAITLLVAVRLLLAVRENARLVDERASNELRFRALVQHSSDVVVLLDASGRIRYISPSVERVLGWRPPMDDSGWLHGAVHPDDQPSARGFLETLAGAPGTSRTVTLRFRDARDSWRHIETVGTSLLHDPAVRGIVLNTRDVSERAALEAELTRQAFADPLTGLANRARFRERAAYALDRAVNAPSSVAVVFVDLDDFKRVNDSFGHSVGDRLLVHVAERLLSATRGSDTVARLGGDEFAVLLHGVTGDAEVMVVADRIAAALRRPVVLEGSEILPGGSIGIARGADGESGDDLLRNADVAMYVSKRSTTRRAVFFESAMHAAVRERLVIEAELRHAIERGELELAYQPVVALRDASLVGVEALVRWRHPRRGQVPPSEFVPVAEETGLIHALGRWVLDEACRQGAEWRSSLSEDRPFTIAVNISGRQFALPSLADDVAGALARSGLPAHALLLEITESAFARDTDATLDHMRALKDAGVQLAIDDFGTGYSSLAYLRRFPIDVLKIDKSFVDQLSVDGDGGSLARMIIALAHTLGLDSIGEGIERDDQRAALEAMGCALGQGYLFSRPVPAERITALLSGAPARESVEEIVSL